MQKGTKINNISPKQADSKSEMFLLGFIEEEAERIEYGKIVFEITVHNKKMTNVQSKPSTRSFSLNVD